MGAGTVFFVPYGRCRWRAVTWHVMDEDPGKASPDRGLEGWNLRWRQGALRCRRAAGNCHGGGPSGWWDASRPGPPGERRARAAATAGPGGADGPAPGHPVHDDRRRRRDRRRAGEGEGAEHAAFHAADPAGQRDEPPGQLPGGVGEQQAPPGDRQPASPKQAATATTRRQRPAAGAVPPCRRPAPRPARQRPRLARPTAARPDGRRQPADHRPRPGARTAAAASTPGASTHGQARPRRDPRPRPAAGEHQGTVGRRFQGCRLRPKLP